MSQITNSILSIGPAGPIVTLTGNSGGAIPPDGAGNINVIGTGTIDVAGAGNTLTISNTTAAETVKFHAFASADIPSVTGDSTDYTVQFDTAIFNTGAAYNTGTGVFTAPSDGLYFFSAGVTSEGYTAIHNGYQLLLRGSVYIITLADVNPGVIYDGVGGDDITLNGSSIVQMSAGDTMAVVLGVDGSTKTIGIHGAALPDLFTWFNGYKIA